SRSARSKRCIKAANESSFAIWVGNDVNVYLCVEYFHKSTKIVGLWTRQYNKNDLHRSQKSLFLQQHREISSVGSEHYLDKVGVTGSSPVFPTVARPTIKPGFFIKPHPYPPVRRASGIHYRAATST